VVGSAPGVPAVNQKSGWSYRSGTLNDAVNDAVDPGGMGATEPSNPTAGCRRVP
jgi:hypothetical protein